MTDGAETGLFGAYARTAPDGTWSMTLSVNGIHCAGCISRIESTLKSVPGVRAARLNFSTQRLHLLWDGARDDADALAERVRVLGYGVAPYDSEAVADTQVKESRFLLMCLGVAGFAAGNIMLVSLALWITDIDTMGPATRDFLHWISAMIAIPAIAFSGRPFFLSAYNALRRGRTNMDVPISVGLFLTTTMSLFEWVQHGEHAYFDSAVMLMFFLLIGRYLDFRARANARRAAGDLLAVMGGAATVIEHGAARRIPVREVQQGMVLQVAPGERIAADGVVMQGRSDLDLSLVTGESQPCAVSEGDRVYAGTLNLSNSLRIAVEKAAESSFLADILRLIEKAEQGQALYVRLADRAAKLYTPVVHALALLTFLGWIFIGHAAWQEALMIAVTVLIITCPCALGLAVPVVQVLAVSRLMKHGVLVKSGDALERLATIDTILVDKTGTLTEGKPQLLNRDDIDEADLHLAASLAAHSRHPLSRAVTAAWQGELLDLVPCETPGKGLEAPGPNGTIRLGSREWCGVDADGLGQTQALELWLRVGVHKQVQFIFGDRIREDAAPVIQALSDRGLAIHLLSGDRQKAVADMAQQTGIASWQGAMLPQQKLERLEALRAEGHHILMVGDGLNDAPVMAAADSSMSPSSGADLSQNAADIVFHGDLLKPVLLAYDTARFSQRLVRENFALSVVYNLLAIPLAMAGFVTPLVAAVAMSSSSLVVILNSFRLRRRV